MPAQRAATNGKLTKAEKKHIEMDKEFVRADNAINRRLTRAERKRLREEQKHVGADITVVKKLTKAQKRRIQNEKKRARAEDVQSPSCPPPKRPRVHTAFAQPQSDATFGLTRNTEFWFLDGNIVLIAGKMAYRVHKGVLADISPVFREMFFGAHPLLVLGDARSFDNCPSVHLFEAEDEVEQLLNIIYRGRRYVHNSSDLIPPS